MGMWHFVVKRLFWDGFPDGCSRKGLVCLEKGAAHDWRWRRKRREWNLPSKFQAEGGGLVHPSDRKCKKQAGTSMEAALVFSHSHA